MVIGCHLSSARGYAAMGREAQSIEANTFQFFTRNPRGGSVKPFDAADAQALVDFTQRQSFGPLVAHAPYTLNACAAEPRIREFARLCMREDLARLAHLPGCLYNFHPGSHVGQGVEAGVDLTSALLNELMTRSQTTHVLFETMSGQGSEIGATFEQLAELIARTREKERIGVCLDTCHVFAAGYDIRNDPDGVLTAFDRIVGLRYLKAVHLNDSMQPLGSRRDRHQRIGAGEIGLDAIRRIVRHDALKALPFILETPNELPGYAAEIQLLRSPEELGLE